MPYNSSKGISILTELRCHMDYQTMILNKWIIKKEEEVLYNTILYVKILKI